MKKINLNLHKLWTVVLMIYIICNAAFSYGDLRILNTLALYLFFGVSVLITLLRRNVRVDITVIALIAYTVIVFIGMLYTPTKYNKVRSVVYDYITMLILTICVVQYIREVADLEHIMSAYMLAGLALAIYVYAQYGNEFWTILQENAERGDENRINRLGAELTNTNNIGMFTAFSVVIGIYQLIFNRKNWVNTIFCAATVIFCFVVSMSAGSKKAILIIFAALVGLYFYNAIGNRDLLKQFRNFLLVFASIAAVVLLLTNLPIFSGIAMRYENLFSFLEGDSGSSSEIERMNMITKGLKVWWDTPIFGAGTAASVHYFGVYSHNNYVEILMNSGLLGFFVFYGVYLYAGGKYIVNARKYKKVNNIPMLLFAVLLSISVAGIAMVYYYDRYTMILVATVFAAIRVMESAQKAENGEKIA